MERHAQDRGTIKQQLRSGIHTAPCSFEAFQVNDEITWLALLLKLLVPGIDPSVKCSQSDAERLPSIRHWLVG
jgi:hypothetical protein